MTTLLQLNTSLFSTGGQSSQLANAFVADWKDANPDSNVVVRDLATNPVPHLTGERFQAFLTKPEDRTEAQNREAAVSDELVAQLQAADVLVIGLPLYNYGVPSTLKAYFDHVARAGITFRYTATGPEGLLKGKKAYLFATRGGVHAGFPRDTQTGHVRDFLAFLGITDVEFIYAEGLAMGDAVAKPALEKATLAAHRLASRVAETRLAA
ncbi:FMN-dependent NADH-azoreductase [Usitatibacter rugosus]|uniref:FMN dependent NADH:quinone oxidoreductase n=1 Tax=Usitatibacter rugosus TaxID=2732067 RepID=A0A6M4GXL5_9PROT|nr:NAD(P)H-dependent oxidoreductase [Usitatibacter rugosus]QJR12021.1 FMN-dependent NADH-azoreductase [Usitatibacter rugosus]